MNRDMLHEMVVSLKCYQFRLSVRATRILRHCTVGILLGQLIISCGKPEPTIRVGPLSALGSSTGPTKTDVCWPFSERFKLTTSDLEHGERQLEQMVSDRPEMSRCVARKSPLWCWCARQFAGAALGQRIYWNDSAPMDSAYGADHIMAQDGRPVSIRVGVTLLAAKGAKRASCQDLWRGAIFELNNTLNDFEFMRINDEACSGKLTREAFLESVTRLEYISVVRVAEIHRNLWKETVVNGRLTTTDWGEYIPATYKKWISGYQDRSGYPWSSWGKYYDEKIVPYVRSGRE